MTALWKYAFISRASSSESMPSEMVVKPAISVKRMVNNCFSAPGLRSVGVAGEFFDQLGGEIKPERLLDQLLFDMKLDGIDKPRTRRCATGICTAT